jgi:hypothetical protein
MVQYWIVGATVQKNDVSKFCIEKGIWFADQQNSQDMIKNIKKNDRLIIKKGYASPTIKIKAYGVVDCVYGFDEDWFRIRLFSVNWLDLRDLNISIPSHGIFQAIAGPFKKEDVPIEEILAYL